MTVDLPTISPVRMWLLSSLAILIASGCRQFPVAYGGSSRTQEFTGFFINASLATLETSTPEALIETYGIPMSRDQLQCTAVVDETLLHDVRAQLYRLPNLGPMRVLWTGFTPDDNTVKLGAWDGHRFAFRTIAETGSRKTYGLDTIPPDDQRFVYVLVVAESGLIYTDGIEFRRRLSKP